MNRIIKEENGVVYFDVSTAKHPGVVAIIDVRKKHLLKGNRWHCHETGGLKYVRRKIGKGKHELLHRRIVGKIVENRFVDHISGDPLDNRRCNLRACSHSENMRNRKPNKGKRFKGVRAIGDKYQAVCSQVYLGSFETKEEAAIAYNKYAKKIYGKFARLNKV